MLEDSIIATLEATQRYRVLRRVPEPPPMPTDMNGLHKGIYVDAETTGLDAAVDGIIQLALFPFAYDDTGAVRGVGTPLIAWRDPGFPIPEAITRLTGIDDDMVRGHAIDPDIVQSFIGAPDLVVSHHAAFDRKFVERLMPVFRDLLWGCSMADVDWQNAGYEGRKLSHLLAQAGYFYDAHRADSDCLAALHLIGLPLPDDRTALAQIVAATRRPLHRVWAIGAPFDRKNQLKARGYRWNPGTDGRHKAWSKEVRPDELDDEEAWLAQNIVVFPVIDDIDPLARFSERG